MTSGRSRRNSVTSMSEEVEVPWSTTTVTPANDPVDAKPVTAAAAESTPLGTARRRASVDLSSPSSAAVSKASGASSSAPPGQTGGAESPQTTSRATVPTVTIAEPPPHADLPATARGASSSSEQTQPLTARKTAEGKTPRGTTPRGTTPRGGTPRSSPFRKAPPPSSSSPSSSERFCCVCISTACHCLWWWIAPWLQAC